MTQPSKTVVYAPDPVPEDLHPTAIQSQQHLLQWLNASGRKYMVWVATDLVKAVKWPEGVADIMQLVSLYRDVRRGQAAVIETDGRCVAKSDALTIGEEKEAVQQLLASIHTIEPDWSPSA